MLRKYMKNLGGFTFDIFYKYFWKLMFYQIGVGKPSFTCM